jgi:hypothetical protein
MDILPRHNCIIKTSPQTINDVYDLLIGLGFTASSDITKKYSGFVVGRWSEGLPHSLIQDSDVGMCRIIKPEWPFIDASQNLEHLRNHLGLEEFYDETPLPHDMDKEKADEIQKRFNLSPDQWDAIPPLAREALGGVQVVTKEVEQSVPTGWIPVAERMPRDGLTVLATDRPLSTPGDSSHAIVAYTSEGDWYDRTGDDPPWEVTHWAPMPGNEAAHVRTPEELQDGEDEEQDNENDDTD